MSETLNLNGYSNVSLETIESEKERRLQILDDKLNVLQREYRNLISLAENYRGYIDRYMGLLKEDAHASLVGECQELQSQMQDIDNVQMLDRLKKVWLEIDETERKRRELDLMSIEEVKTALDTMVTDSELIRLFPKSSDSDDQCGMISIMLELAFDRVRYDQLQEILEEFQSVKAGISEAAAETFDDDADELDDFSYFSHGEKFEKLPSNIKNELYAFFEETENLPSNFQDAAIRFQNFKSNVETAACIIRSSSDQTLPDIEIFMNICQKKPVIYTRDFFSIFKDRFYSYFSDEKRDTIFEDCYPLLDVYMISCEKTMFDIFLQKKKKKAEAFANLKMVLDDVYDSALENYFGKIVALNCERTSIDDFPLFFEREQDSRLTQAEVRDYILNGADQDTIKMLESFLEKKTSTLLKKSITSDERLDMIIEKFADLIGEVKQSAQYNQKSSVERAMMMQPITKLN